MKTMEELIAQAKKDPVSFVGQYMANEGMMIQLQAELKEVRELYSEVSLAYADKEEKVEQLWKALKECGIIISH